MSRIVEPQLLRSYVVDRSKGATLSGPTELVVLILTDTNGRETAIAMSKADAMIISGRLHAAAQEAQTAMRG